MLLFYTLTVISKYRIVKVYKIMDAIKKHYNTQINLLLIDLFNNVTTPLTSNDIEQLLNNKGFLPNKSTIYRQLDKLEVANKIRSFQSNNCTFWENKITPEHGHLICNECETVKCLTANQVILDQTDKIIFDLETLVIKGKCKDCS
jgi:Fe2+ or Zn2+ uptake regulation protein